MVYINTTGKHNEVWLDKPYATITVECPECPSTEDAYSSGYTDGSEEGYHKGYPSGYTDGYDSGYTDGAESVDCEDFYNSGYTSGYTDGQESVDCSDFYNSGVTDGIAEQKAKMIPLSVTQNDYVFRREDGYNEVEVHVPINLQRKYLDLTSEDFEDWGNEYRAKSGNSFAFEVRPDYGYTGLSRVSVTARVSVVPALNKGYNSGYTAGYDSGYTDGLNACSGGNEDLIANLQGDYFIIPEGTTKLRDYAFYHAPISSITIPSSVTSIGNYAFTNVPFSSITIPSSVTSIGGSSFAECSNLTEIVIPDTVNSLGPNAVFMSCSQLTAATLPSGLTRIGNSFFQYTSLTGITLPTGITSIDQSAFDNSKLTGNIVIPSGVTHIYTSAFRVCSGLTSMTFESPVPATITATSNSTASLGSSAYTWPIYVPCEAVDTYKTAWPYYAHRIMCNPNPDSGSTSDYLTIETLSAGSISWIKSVSAFSSKTIDYRVNGGSWSSITSDISSSAPTIAVQAGDIVEFRGDNDSYGNDTGNTGFGASVPFNVKGNIMSLFDSTDFENLNDFPAATTNNLRGLFASSQVIDASNLLLPATALTESCYAAMFSNCIYLTAAPELPATALAVACYESMFDGCRDLATVPSILPATTLKDNCYHDMFQGCRSLVTAPELPATTLRVQSYQNMFRDCVSLNYIKCLATDLSNSGTSYWVQNVSSSGTFIKHASMSSWTTGDSGIPSNWNVQDAV